MRSLRVLTATLSTGLLAVAAAVAVPTAAAAGSSTPSITHFTGTLSDGTVWIADVPAPWNGTLLLYSHGFGPLTAADAPDPTTQAALLTRGYALAGSSYDPTGSEWALDTAVSDQFGTLHAVESGVLPHRPHMVLAVGSSMGGLISSLEAQDGAGRINGALTTCGIVAGGINLNEYQLFGEYAMAQLLLPGQAVQLVGFSSPTSALATAASLQAAAAQSQQTAAGRARLALALAFLNVPAWDPSQSAPAPDDDPAAEEAAQYDVEFTGAFSTLDFIEFARPSIDQADGGSANWTAGVNFFAALADSPYLAEVTSLYHAAGLSLAADLANLSRNANITADPGAVRSLDRTSVPTGRLEVPELDVHTVGDQLVAVQQENYYAGQVQQADSGNLLRQAFVARYGHCNFSTAELVAGVLALSNRVTTGRWAQLANPANLNEVASSLNLGPAQFADFYPGPLTGAVSPDR